MAAQEPVIDSDRESKMIRGALFKVSARIGVIVFAGVWVLALSHGLEPMLALIRASLALLAITSCGWLAEKLTRNQRLPEPEAAPETLEATDEPAAVDAGDSDQPEARAA
jgi:hypothetical protein